MGEMEKCTNASLTKAAYQIAREKLQVTLSNPFSRDGLPVKVLEKLPDAFFHYDRERPYWSLYRIISHVCLGAFLVSFPAANFWPALALLPDVLFHLMFTFQFGFWILAAYVYLGEMVDNDVESSFTRLFLKVPLAAGFPSYLIFHLATLFDPSWYTGNLDSLLTEFILLEIYILVWLLLVGLAYIGHHTVKAGRKALGQVEKAKAVLITRAIELDEQARRKLQQEPDLTMIACDNLEIEDEDEILGEGRSETLFG